MSRQLRALARFLPALEAPDFKAGEMVCMGEQEPGVWTLPYANESETVLEFVAAAYKHGWVRPEFDWMGWAQTEEAKALIDDDAKLAAAAPEQLAQLLTAAIRRDRFVEGALLEAFESGLILRIVRRAAELIRAGKSG